MVQCENPSKVIPSGEMDQNSEELRRQPTHVMRNDYNSQIFQDPQRERVISDEFKRILLDIYKNYTKTITISLNCIVVFLLIVAITKFFTSNCDDNGKEVSKGVRVNCEPFLPVERVVVDIDLNISSHCYSAYSCVELGHTLKTQQDKFRYNFIIGAYGFVFMEHGYTCKSEESKEALYIRLPADSIYNGQDFMAAYKAVSKFNEILREGLECGKILYNYTITATGCGMFNDWCTHVLQEFVMEGQPNSVSGPRIDYYDKVKVNTFFNPLNLNRVYNYQYKLVVCNQNFSGKKR